MHFGAPLLRSERDDALVIAHCKIEMDCAHTLIARTCSRGPLFGRSAPIIDKVSIHSRHPPMAEAKRNATNASR